MRTKDMRQFGGTHVLLYAFSFSVLVVSFFPAISYDFAHHDDWNFWAYNRWHMAGHPTYYDSHQQARPTIGRIASVINLCLNRTSDLRYVRLLFIGVLSLVAVLLTLRLMKLQLSIGQAFFTAAAVLLLPAPAVYVCFVSCGPACLALVFAALTAFFIERIVSHRSMTLSRLTVRRSLIGATVFFLLALTTSTPASMFVFLFASIPYIFGKPTQNASSSTVVKLYAWYSMGCVLYFCIYKYCLSRYWGHWVGLYAFELVGITSIPEKLSYFFCTISYKALSLWCLMPNPWVASICGFLIVTGWALGFAARLKNSETSWQAVFEWLIQLAALIAFVNIPVLVPSTGHDAQRIFFPYATVLALLLLFACQHWIVFFFGKERGATIWQYSLAASVCILGTISYNNVLTGFVVSNATEYRFLRDQLRLRAEEGFSEVVVILGDRRLSVYGVPVWSLDEFGFQSSIMEHKHMINYALEENNISLDVGVVAADENWPDADELPPNTVDLRELQRMTKLPALVYWPLLPLLAIASAVFFAQRWVGITPLAAATNGDQAEIERTSRMSTGTWACFELAGLFCLFLVFFWFTGFEVTLFSLSMSLLFSSLVLGEQNPFSVSSILKNEYSRRTKRFVRLCGYLAIVILSAVLIYFVNLQP